MVEKSFWLRIIFFLCLFFGAPAGVTPAAAGERHPFTVADLLAMERIGDPQVSPDGGRVAYTVARADPAANRLRSAVYITDLHRPVSVFLPPDKSDEDTNPRWSPDGKILYFLSARSGARQIWQVSPATRKPRQVTSLPLDVRAFEVSPDGSFFILAMAVIPGRTGGEESKASPAKKGTPATGSGMIFDRMPVRFWDTWSDGKRNHLFYYPLPGGPAQDLMAAMDADCPSPAGGGSEEFSCPRMAGPWSSPPRMRDAARPGPPTAISSWLPCRHHRRKYRRRRRSGSPPIPPPTPSPGSPRTAAAWLTWP